MKFPLLFLRVGFHVFLLSVTLTLFGFFAGKTLPYTGELAYISTRTGVNRIYLLDVQRRINFQIKRLFINDCCLTWSPDGQTLAFVADISQSFTDIFSVNFHSPIQRLTSADGVDLYPTFSPDGKHIAYTGYGYGNPEIYLMNADGSQPHVLTGEKNITTLNPRPVWSADGQSILFSDFANLDSLLAVPISCIDPCEAAIHPAFNTNGLPLMTTSFVPLDQSRMLLAAFERTTQGGYAMYALDTRSSQAPERLSINANLSSPSLAVYDHWVAYVSGNTDMRKSVGEANLFVLDSTCIGSPQGCSGSIQKITADMSSEDNISWSADGHWLAFVTIVARRSQLNLLDTTCIYQHLDCTGYIHPQPITSARFIQPNWRPPIR
ncbi:MAG: hypothetical protein GC179_16670 [Anaerolineaceae bacterium]|nr:hypothetical protein [Anaerolineaceae bacterium]